VLRRVVVTGIGAVTPLANNVYDSWDLLVSGKSGIGRITLFDPKDHSVQISGEIPNFDVLEYISAKEVKKVDRFIILAIAAAEEAMKKFDFKFDNTRFGVSIGSGIGGLSTIEKTSNNLYEGGPRKVSPFFIPSSLVNLAAGNVAIRFGFRGPNLGPATACAAGANAIAESYNLIKYGLADYMLCGGAEAPVCPVGVAGFSSIKALCSNFNDTPELASRPFDKDRSGFVMSEGAATLVLEEREQAINRGAEILAEIVGIGFSGDAGHITNPNGEGAYLAMYNALHSAGIDHVDYINAHGTSTQLGDIAEFKAIERLFKKSLSISSTKSAVGHMLGASGAFESIACILALRDGVIPPTLNLDNIDEECIVNDTRVFDLVPKKSIKKSLEYVMSNSFGFGGVNVSLIFKKHIEKGI
jgi:3-oxoacyl-[acyl-carrier-protein] synthase II